MNVNYLDYQETIAKNIILFMRERGYSRLSLSKLSGIARLEIDRILNAQNTEKYVYCTQIVRIKQKFNLTDDYILSATQINSLLSPPIVDEGRSELAQEMLDGLDHILDIYSMYLK
jgi:transcriptional regulator with XRE-family HTH domain